MTAPNNSELEAKYLQEVFQEVERLKKDFPKDWVEKERDELLLSYRRMEQLHISDHNDLNCLLKAINGTETIGAQDALRKYNQIHTLAKDLAEALKHCGKVKQFHNQYCFCDTSDGSYCVGQEQCDKANKALLRAREANLIE